MSAVSGKRWSYAALIFGAGISLLGNITHTVLASSTVAMGIRLPLAIVWPIALVIGVEVLVRVNWRRTLLDWIGRFVIIVPVSAVAGVVSYRHLNSLMEMGGEDGFSSMIGPLAIDGLMLGGTIALLAIRAMEMLPSSPSVDALLERWSVQDEETIPVSSPPLLDRALDVLSMSPSDRRDAREEREHAPEVGKSDPFRALAVPDSQYSPSRLRSSWDAARVVEMALDGVRASVAHEETGIGVSTYGRYLRVARLLRQEPASDVTKEKVPAEHVRMMRLKLATR